MHRLIATMFILLSTAHASLDSDITAIAKDKNGFIWYGGQFGLKQLVGTQKVDMLPQSLASELGIIRDIAFTRNDLLLATKHQGIWSYQLGRSLYRPTMEGQTLWVKDLVYNDQDQSTLALGNNFIARLSGDDQAELIYQAPNISFFRALHFDNGHLILSSKGIYQLKENKLTQLNNTYAYDILEHEKQLYLATPEGLAILSDDFQSVSYPTAINESIYSLASSPQGILVGGTNAYFELNDTNATRRDLNSCGRVPRILHHTEIFIGCQQGLVVINRHERTAKTLPATSLLTSDGSALWLATSNEGIGRLTSTGIEYLTQTAPYLANHLLYDVEKIDDNVFVGTDRGAFSVNIETQKLNPILEGVKIHAILAFEDKILLGGYENFLASYDGENVKRIELDKRITTVIDLNAMGDHLILSDDSGVFKLNSQFEVVDFLPSALTTKTLPLSAEEFIAITHGRGAIKVKLRDFSETPLINSRLAKNLSNDYFIYGELLNDKLFIYHRGGYGYLDMTGNHWVNISTKPTMFIRRPLAIIDSQVFFSDNLKLVQYVPAQSSPFHVSVPLIKESFVTSRIQEKHFQQHSGMFLAIGGSNAYTEEELNNVEYAWQFDDHPPSGKSFESTIPMHTSPPSLLGADSMAVAALNFTTGQYTQVRLPFSVSVHSFLAPKALLLYSFILFMSFLLFAYIRRIKQAELERAEKLAYFDLKKYHHNINAQLGKIVSALDHIKNVILIPSSDTQKQEFHQVYRDIILRIRTVAQHFNQPFSYDLNTALQELAAEAKLEDIDLVYLGEEALQDLDRKVENAVYTVLKEVISFFLGQAISNEIRIQFKIRSSLGYSHRLAISIQSSLPKAVDHFLFSQFHDSLKGKMHRYMGSLQSFSNSNEKFQLNLEFKAVKNHPNTPDSTDTSKNRPQVKDTSSSTTSKTTPLKK